MLFFLPTLQKIPILLSTVIFEFLLFHHTLFSFWVVEKEAKKEYVSRLPPRQFPKGSVLFFQEQPIIFQEGPFPPRTDINFPEQIFSKTVSVAASGLILCSSNKHEFSSSRRFDLFVEQNDLIISSNRY